MVVVGFEPRQLGFRDCVHTPPWHKDKEGIALPLQILWTSQRAICQSNVRHAGFNTLVETHTSVLWSLGCFLVTLKAIFGITFHPSDNWGKWGKVRGSVLPQLSSPCNSTLMRVKWLSSCCFLTALLISTKETLPFPKPKVLTHPWLLLLSNALQ